MPVMARPQFATLLLTYASLAAALRIVKEDLNLTKDAITDEEDLTFDENVSEGFVQVGRCVDIEDEQTCLDSIRLRGVSCVGWGGRHCLPYRAPPNNIHDQEICDNAWRLFRINALGWGGTTCLAPGAQCSEITWPHLCDTAKKKLNMNCAGWGGDRCLAANDSARLITDYDICMHSKAWLNIANSGWDSVGWHCKPLGSRCSDITNWQACEDKRDTGECLGWGGNVCIDKGGSAAEITDKAKCEKSMELFGIESLGWGGSDCLKPDATCEDITKRAVCTQAEESLGLKCIWGGHSCLTPGPNAVKHISTQEACAKLIKVANLKKSLKGWSGSHCMTAFEDCASITHRVVCRMSKTLLGMRCGTWHSKFGCLSRMHEGPRK